VRFSLLFIELCNDETIDNYAKESRHKNNRLKRKGIEMIKGELFMILIAHVFQFIWEVFKLVHKYSNEALLVDRRYLVLNGITPLLVKI